MKRLKSVETEEFQLEVLECDCGFHLGIDATWLDQCDVENFEMECPACKRIIKVDELTRD